MQWIICYDIKEDKRRRKVHRRLKQYSGGYQLSGFEVAAIGQASSFALLNALSPFITEEDALLLLQHTGIGPDWQLGCGPSTGKKTFLVWD